MSPDDTSVTAGWRCAVCGSTLGIDAALPWRCPLATTTDPHHVLWPVTRAGTDADRHVLGLVADEPNPFVRFGPRLAWWAFARARGMSHDACADLTREVAADFVVTPFGPSELLSDRLGADVWVKDETGDVAGSHKGRHLVTILLHLRAAEELGLLANRPRLAIASCGNAALAAATLAVRVGWPIDVYVPEWMDDAFGDRLDALGVDVHRSPRRADGPPGDPALRRFREAVAAGAIPFSVQGPENALCLDGGRTLGWEMAASSSDRPLDAVFVQVGGGAFATCVGWGVGAATRLHAVQAEGCAPLARAWERARSVDHPAQHWAELMTPWPSPHSIADGILDDETYDWLGVLDVMRVSGGVPVVAPEADIVAAFELAGRAGFDASATGSAGLAGLLAHPDLITPGERVALVMSGVAR